VVNQDKVSAHSVRTLAPWVFGLGLILGLTLAIYGIITDREPSDLHATGIAARVNDVPIALETLELVLNGLAGDKRNGVNDTDRSHALDVLIDEELLFQAGINDGLVRADPDLRKRVVNAALRRVISVAETEVLTPDILPNYYNQNKDYFTPVGAIAAEVYFVPSALGQAEKIAEAIRQSLAKGQAISIEKVRNIFPDGTMPIDHLPGLVGAIAAEKLATLPDGAILNPMPAPGGFYVGRVTQRIAGTLPPFEAIQSAVESEYRRRRSDQLLSDYIARLRRRAVIEGAR
jgi:hypothetical protein